MHVRLLVNPRASSMTATRSAGLAAGLGAAPSVDRVDVVATAARGHATALAAEAAAAGVDVVVVAAGDGTLNEAAAGLLGTATALAPLPGGSTNVFARAVGYANRLRPALAQLGAALGAGPARRIGIGLAGPRPFLFHLGVGFDAAVVERMERLDPRVKRVAAHPAFAWQTVRTLARGVDRATPVIHVSVPGGQNHDARFTVVSNLAPYSYVGPRRMLLTPDAALDRALAVTSLTRLRLRDAAGAFASSVGRARHLQHAREVVQLHDVEVLRLESPDRAFPWQVDGDHLGTTHALDVRHVPDALAVVLPA